MTDQTVQPPTETITALAEQGVGELEAILDALRGQPADSTATTENFSDDEGPRVVLIADPLHADEGDRAAFEVRAAHPHRLRAHRVRGDRRD